MKGTPWVLCFALFSCAPDDGSVAINDQCYAYYPDSVCPPEDKSNRHQVESCDELDAYMGPILKPFEPRDHNNRIGLAKSIVSGFECADNYGLAYFGAAYFVAAYHTTESKFHEALPIIDDSIRRLEMPENDDGIDDGIKARGLFFFYTLRTDVSHELGDWSLVLNDLCAADQLLLSGRIPSPDFLDITSMNDNFIAPLKKEINFSADICQGEIK